jgi:hypothetical protein
MGHSRAIRLAAAVVAATVVGPAAAASARPANDDFRDAALVRVGRDVRGTIRDATIQPGEPRHATRSTEASVWYRLRVRHRLALMVNTCTSNFDSVVAVYSGRSIDGLRAVDFNDDGCREGAGSRVSFTARPRHTYVIAVAGFSPRGHFRLGVHRFDAPPNDDFAYARPIRLGETLTGTTRNATRELGEPRHAFTDADQTVWFRLRLATGRRVELNTCGSRFDTVLAVYRGRQVDRLRRVASNDDDPRSCGLDSRVRFRARAHVTYRIALAEFFTHESGRYTLNAR